jgi:hypothetical protein
MRLPCMNSLLVSIHLGGGLIPWPNRIRLHGQETYPVSLEEANMGQFRQPVRFLRTTRSKGHHLIALKRPMVVKRREQFSLPSFVLHCIFSLSTPLNQQSAHPSILRLAFKFWRHWCLLNRSPLGLTTIVCPSALALTTLDFLG